MIEVDSTLVYDSLGDYLEIVKSFTVSTIDLVPYINNLIDIITGGQWGTLVYIGQAFLDFFGVEYDIIWIDDFVITYCRIIYLCQY